MSSPLQFLLDHLETADVAERRKAAPFRMPVQSVDASLRAFTGTVASGSIRPGDEVVVLPSGRTSAVKSVIGRGGSSAQTGDAITVTLADEIEAAAGDMLADARNRPQIADQFAAHLVWMSSDPLLPGRSYFMKVNEGTLAATVSELKHKLDIDTLAQLAA